MGSKYLRLLSYKKNRATYGVIIKVLKDLLKRTLTENDLKKVVIYREQGALDYMLAYNGVELGVIKVKPDSVGFEPLEDGFLDNIIDENWEVKI